MSWYPHWITGFGAILVAFSSCSREERLRSAVFSADAFRLLPLEEPDPHDKALKACPVHAPRRDLNARVMLDREAPAWRRKHGI